MCSEKQSPYVEKRIETVVRLYNPKFGDERMCVCGHMYDRHFDRFEDENDQDSGCKYCGCMDFRERTENPPERPDVNPVMKQLMRLCESDVSSFTNEQMSTAITVHSLLWGRFCNLADEMDRVQASKTANDIRQILKEVASEKF